MSLALPPGRALVTGAGKRLGKAMALALAENGWDVAVHYDRSQAEAEAVADEIKAMGRSAVALRADLLDDTATMALLPRAAEALGGKLTLLVNNASIFEYDTIKTATLTSWDRAIGSNLKAPFLLTQAFAAQELEPARDEKGEAMATGLIVNMIDQRVLRPTPAFMTYSLAKHGLWALTRTAAQGLAPAIRVNGIGPGPTIQGVRQSDAHFAAQRAGVPLQRGADARDVVAALRFFIASPSVSGQLICTDGAQHLAWKTPDIIGEI